jgi:hypothetical protein
VLSSLRFRFCHGCLLVRKDDAWMYIYKVEWKTKGNTIAWTRGQGNIVKEI